MSLGVWAQRNSSGLGALMPNPAMLGRRILAHVDWRNLVWASKIATPDSNRAGEIVFRNGEISIGGISAGVSTTRKVYIFCSSIFPCAI